MNAATRRQWLKSAGLLSLAYFAKGCGAQVSRDVTDSHLIEYIKAYDLIGLHRTGSEADRATLDWLAAVIGNLGIPSERLQYPFERIDSFDAYIEVGGNRIEGMPLFDSKIHQPQSFSGVLGMLGDAVDIALIKVPPHYALPGGPELMDLRRAAERGGEAGYRGEEGYRGIVAVTDAEDIGIKPGLTPINADRYPQPFGPPVIQVPRSEWLLELFTSFKRRPASFFCQANFVSGSSANLMVELPGQRPDLPPLVVMTPTTGWWHCASERGGGIALWLDLLSRAATKQLPRPVVFIATSGHEIGHYGLKQLLRLSRFSDVHSWLHLGSSFCGYDSFLQLQASNTDLAERAMAEMQQAGVSPDLVYTLPKLPTGEIAEIVDRGGKYLSLSGFNPWFHHPQDRWWQSINPQQTQVMAGIFHTWFDRLLA